MTRIQSLATAVMACSLLAAIPEISAQLEIRRSFPTGTTPLSVVAGDFNGDGKMDIATASVTVSEIQVFLGNGDGTFQAPVSYDVGGGADAIAVGDLNHDGVLDLIAVNTPLNSVAVLLGNGDGTFQAPVSYATPAGPAYIALGDFNGDGKLDIATTTGGALACCWAMVTAHFRSPLTPPCQAAPRLLRRDISKEIATLTWL